MHIYIIFAHPSQKSYSKLVLDSFIQGISEAGHSFEIGDLYNINKQDLGGEDIAVQIEMMLDDAGSFHSGWRPPVSMTDAINGIGIKELLQNIMDHEEHVKLSDVIIEKKKNRFEYKIKELLFSKVEKIVSEKLFNEEEVTEILQHSLNDGKFKIYKTIHDKFEDVNFEIRENN